MDDSFEIGNATFMEFDTLEMDMDRPLSTPQLISLSFSAIFNGVGLLASFALLLLIFLEQIVKKTTDKLILVSIIVFTVCEIIILPFDIPMRIHESWLSTHTACQFYFFTFRFLWMAKGLLVFTIAIFAFVESRVGSTTIPNERVKFVVTIAVVTGLSTIFAGLGASLSGTRDIGYMDTVVCSSMHGSLATTIVEIISYVACAILPAIISVVLVVVSVCQRRATEPHKVAPIMIVGTFAVLWIPIFVAMTTAMFVNVPWILYLALFGISDFELALTPILLLVVPTTYNKALRKRCCGQRNEEIDQIVLQQDVVELKIGNY